MTKNITVEVCVEELGRRQNITLKADVSLYTWKGSHATYWEPASDGGYEVTKVAVTDVNGKLQRARFPKLFASLDQIVAEAIENDNDLVVRQFEKEGENYEMDYEGWGS